MFDVCAMLEEGTCLTWPPHTTPTMTRAQCWHPPLSSLTKQSRVSPPDMEAMFDVCTMLGEGTCFTWSPHSATPTKQSRVSPISARHGSSVWCLCNARRGLLLVESTNYSFKNLPRHTHKGVPHTIGKLFRSKKFTGQSPNFWWRQLV